VVEALAQRRILAGVPVSRLHPGRAELQNLLLVAASETTTEADVSAFASALTEVLR
jgi:glycine dehydrogenase subunit 1